METHLILDMMMEEGSQEPPPPPPFSRRMSQINHLRGPNPPIAGER